MPLAAADLHDRATRDRAQHVGDAIELARPHGRRTGDAVRQVEERMADGVLPLALEPPMIVLPRAWRPRPGPPARGDEVAQALAQDETEHPAEHARALVARSDARRVDVAVVVVDRDLDDAFSRAQGLEHHLGKDLGAGRRDLGTDRLPRRAPKSAVDAA